MGAGHLKIGDKIKQADGTTGLVANVTTIQQTQEMFNLTVDEAHTFYVGTNGRLMHNAGGVPKLPKDPNDLIKQGWKEITDPRNSSGSRDFINPETGMKVRFDPGTPGDNGFRGVDHWHVENPNTTGKVDQYLDKDGNPVKRGSGPSHILPEGCGEL